MQDTSAYTEHHRSVTLQQRGEGRFVAIRNELLHQGQIRLPARALGGHHLADLPQQADPVNLHYGFETPKSHDSISLVPRPAATGPRFSKKGPAPRSRGVRTCPDP